MARRRSLGRLILRPVTTIGRLRRLQLNVVVASVGRSVVVGGRWVIAVVVIRLLRRLILLLLLAVVRLRIVCRLTVARWCATQGPTCATVGSVATLSATTSSNASCGLLVVLCDLRGADELTRRGRR